MITISGTGVINKIVPKKNFFIVTLEDNSSTIIHLKVPCSYKKLILLNERVNFSGTLDEDGIVETENFSRAYLELLGFSFSSSEEKVFTFSKKGLYFKVDIEAPRFDRCKKTFMFLGKALNEDALNKIIVSLNSKKISFNGIFLKNIPIFKKISSTGL
ncbi:hypothetical protein ACNSOL_12470 (plasmid) [Aliarcobacter lanthieri]|uniref:hypothetical protein n=1 Tax=Aliarcobacter lanthieri TaxID=1355374 RepID=UPI003AAF5668